MDWVLGETLFRSSSCTALIHRKFIQYTSGLSHLLMKGYAYLFKILFSSTLKTDSEFLFMHIFFHVMCFIAHIHLTAEIC